MCPGLTSHLHTKELWWGRIHSGVIALTTATSGFQGPLLQWLFAMSCTFGSSVSCDIKMSVTVAFMSSLELIPWIVWAVILVGLSPPLFPKLSFPVFPVILWGALYQLSEQITSKHSGLKPWPSHLLCIWKSVILTGLSWAVLLVSL